MHRLLYNLPFNREIQKLPTISIFHSGNIAHRWSFINTSNRVAAIHPPRLNQVIQLRSKTQVTSITNHTDQALFLLQIQARHAQVYKNALACCFITPSYITCIYMDNNPNAISCILSKRNFLLKFVHINPLENYHPPRFEQRHVSDFVNVPYIFRDGGITNDMAEINWSHVEDNSWIHRTLEIRTL